MNAIDLISDICLIIGSVFFMAGTIALLRFPDVYTRLHALAKADNLGLGFTMLGLILRAEHFASGIKLGLIWFLVLVASTAVSFLVARRAHRRGIVYWRNTERQ